MSFFDKLQQLLKLQKKSESYWLKITTKVPHCTYYFGPFDSPWEAKMLQAGYIEDLMEEQAQGVHVELEQRETPEELTICEEEDKL
jgi:hypothetical protein